MRSQEISLLHNEKENHLYHLLTTVPGQLQTNIDPSWGKCFLDLLSQTPQGRDAASNDKIRVSHESTGISSNALLHITEITMRIALVIAINQGIQNKWACPAKGLLFFNNIILSSHPTANSNIPVPGHVSLAQLISMAQSRN